MQHFIPYIIVSFIYAAVALDFWRTAKLPQASTEKTQSLKLHSSMIALGLALHGWILYKDIFAAGNLNFGFYYALSAILWLTVLIYWIADLFYQLQILQAFVLPPAALFVLLPAFAIKNYYLPQIDAGLFMAHIAIAILSYSLFTFAALHASLMAIAERSLHNKSAIFKLPNFPPLMVMESLLFKVISIGFILLTLTVVSGMLFSEEIFGMPMQINHKTIFSVISWFIYAWLLYGRYRYGWRGKTAVRWTLIGFVVLLLAYVGSRFVLHILLGR
jgi:ABC-type uncharacterized transport system permease subunit